MSPSQSDKASRFRAQARSICAATDLPVSARGASSSAR